MEHVRRHSCIILAVAIIVFNSSARADFLGPGGYGNDPYAWIHAGSYESDEEELVLTDEANSDWTFGATLVGDAYAYGDISQSATGTAKACSTMYYHDPFGSGPLSIGADVETWKPFVILPGNSGLSEGETTTVTLTISYHGQFQVYIQTAGKAADARGSFAVTLYDSLGTVLDQIDGDAKITGLSDGSHEAEVTGDWVGHLTGSGNNYAISYGDTISFTGAVGSTYWLYFDLATSAWTYGGGGGFAGNETLAQSDFASTATYELGSESGVEFQIVPEPMTIGLLSASSLGLLWKRRTRPL